MTIYAKCKQTTSKTTKTLPITHQMKIPLKLPLIFHHVKEDRYCCFSQPNMWQETDAKEGTDHVGYETRLEVSCMINIQRK